MSEKKIVIPEGMLQAGWDAVHEANGIAGVSTVLEAALRWLSENPILPTNLAESAIYSEWKKDHDLQYPLWILREWQRRMFLAPEPEVPEEIKDLLVSNEDEKRGIPLVTPSDVFNQKITEAFQRGRYTAMKSIQDAQKPSQEAQTHTPGFLKIYRMHT